MDDHAKLERILKFIVLLSNNVGYSLKELMERTEKSERTVYRYIETIKRAGFIITKDKGYYKIDKNRGSGKDLSDLLHFSEEEAYILSKAIHTIDDNNVLKTNLTKKLYSLYDFDRVVFPIVKKEHSELVHQLHLAMKQKKQIIMQNYSSANSKTISDRLVEPFEFTTNYIGVWCYEPAGNMNKIFKTGRIGKVILTDSNCQHQDKHKSSFTDPFRVSSNKTIHVELELSIKAKCLMTEEYPLSEKYIVPAGINRYEYKGPVCTFDGIGRFILGLPGEIRILKTKALQQWVEKKVKNYYPLTKVDSNEK